MTLAATPPPPVVSLTARGVVLIGEDRKAAERLIVENHYTHCVPSGKSIYVRFGSAIVVWSIPANKNIARFLLGFDGKVWELARLWAPDGHEKNLLTQAISFAVRVVEKAERPDALVSYADPQMGHGGGVYRAASWLFHGQSDESRNYVHEDGRRVARRAFHSGGKAMKKADIEKLGWREVKQPGKLRYVKPLSKRAKAVFNNIEIKHSYRALPKVAPSAAHDYWGGL